LRGKFALYARSQNGYTLVEVVIACAIGAILMVGLTSVVLTSVRAANTATSRVEASAQLRSFQFFAADDFALSSVPSASGCPCTTQPIVLKGLRASNAATPVASAYTVSYTWDGTQFVNRQITGNPSQHAATGVTAFSWYVDTSAARATVVVSLTITVGSYQESQTLRFLPQVKP
jgi:prepilin-type N-terminal cleavage/methylation domain-containing protein